MHLIFWQKNWPNCNRVVSEKTIKILRQSLNVVFARIDYRSLRQAGLRRGILTFLWTALKSLTILINKLIWSSSASQTTKPDLYWPSERKVIVYWCCPSNKWQIRRTYLRKEIPIFYFDTNLVWAGATFRVV